MEIECFEIKWTGPYSLSEIRNKIEASDKGIYAVHKGKDIFYIGMSSKFGRRLTEHKRNWAHMLGEKGVAKLRVFTGIVHWYESTTPSQDVNSTQLRAIESFLINYKPNKPEGNPDSDKKGYHGKISPVVVNTGKAIKLDKVIFHNSSIESLLKSNMIPKKRQSPSYY
ncbi:MAG: hypothetical protein WC369_09310 [Dehalococcoidales bacterium]|jgi:hypothetical protein